MSHPVQEEDRIATTKIVVIAIGSLAVFGVGILWSISIERDEGKTIVTHAEPAPPAAAGAPEVGIVYQWPFPTEQYGEGGENSHFAADKAAATQERLEHYGWIDKKAQVVHIPIEEAMKQYVSQAGSKK
jgi:hypothetical protein